MLESKGMVLKGGMHIRLRDVPGVPGFSEKAQIGEPQVPDQIPGLAYPQIVTRLQQRMHENEGEESQAHDCRKNYIHIRFGKLQSHVSLPSKIFLLDLIPSL